jgi:polysaccharide export outer membrane protein
MTTTSFNLVFDRRAGPSGPAYAVCRVSLLAAVALTIVLPVSAGAQGQSSPAYVIGPQDVLAIQVFDQTDLGGKYTVEADGTISFPLLGRVTAGGMPLRHFESELKKRLADGYFVDPQVSVAVEQYRSQRLFVVGEVRTPGPVPLTGGMTLIEALARAGSTLPSASGEIAIVRARQGSDGPILPPDAGDDRSIVHAALRDLESGTMKQTLELHDGDTIFVPRAETAFVFGEVRSPGGFPIQKDTTILQALSLAGGVTEHGALNRVKAVRLVNGQRAEVKVSLTDIVRPGDTIIVPEKYF